MTYEYACTACGHAWEAQQSISAAPLTECPTCHQATAKRQISGGAGFILKGGGWYADLYSSSGAAKAPAEGAAASDSKAKPAVTPAATPASTSTSTDTPSTPTAPAKGTTTPAASS